MNFTLIILCLIISSGYSTIIKPILSHHLNDKDVTNSNAEILRRTDLTLTPCEVGRAVVQTVNRIIDKSKIFQEDHEATFRSAVALTYFGDHPDTFKDINYAGIWQITQAQLQMTKGFNQNLEQKINEEFGIEWNKMELEDMKIPLYCGIAARILIQKARADNDDKSGWLTISKQSLKLPLIFSRSLTQQGNDNSSHYEASIEQYYEEYPPRGLYDLLIILDGSGSVKPQDYTQALTAISQVFVANKRASDKIRFGFIEYSSSNKIIFDFSNNYSEKQLEEIVLNTKQSGGGTSTASAIRSGTKMFLASQEENRPKISILLTDGTSGQLAQVIAAADEAKAAGIISFAVGIGSGIKYEELVGIAQGDETYVIVSNDYEDLNELHLWIDVATIPKDSTLGVPYRGPLVKSEQSYYKYEMPFFGLTVETSSSSGITDHYYCHTFDNPSAALFDDKINANLIFIKPVEETESSKVFISAEGMEQTNDYTIIAYDGYCLYYANELICQKCGFKQVTDYVLQGCNISTQTEAETVLWEHDVHGYGDLLQIENDMYVSKGIDEKGFYFIKAKPRLTQYILETDLLTMNVTASFSCPGNYISEYTIILDIY